MRMATEKKKLTTQIQKATRRVEFMQAFHDILDEDEQMVNDLLPVFEAHIAAPVSRQYRKKVTRSGRIPPTSASYIQRVMLFMSEHPSQWFSVHDIACQTDVHNASVGRVLQKWHPQQFECKTKVPGGKHLLWRHKPGSKANVNDSTKKGSAA